MTTFPIGKAQEIHEDDIDDEEAIQKTAEIIVETSTYMTMIMSQPNYASLRAVCRNNDEYCSALAANGACEMPDGFEDMDADEMEEDAEASLYNFTVLLRYMKFIPLSY